MHKLKMYIGCMQHLVNLTHSRDPRPQNWNSEMGHLLLARPPHE